MKIKQPVINTFNRVGIPYEHLLARAGTVKVYNRFTGESVDTTPLLAYLVRWVYSTSNQYERGIQNVTISDFDRIRYFILEQDKQVYSTCID